MKTMKHISMTVMIACSWLGLSVTLAGQASQTSPSTERIGVYDSRVIAYAHFWSEAYQQRINDRAKAARDAKAAGQTDRFKELAAAMGKEQEQNHLQVFSTAPVDEILAEMKDRVEAVRKEAGVSQLVSKWDEKTLKRYKKSQQIEVTDQLLREFKLNEKQLKVVADMRKKEPLPLKKAEELMREGKL
jgi:hypothetical protein